MQPAQVLLPLLGVLLLHHQQHVQGAALDLAALVRQYEDQVGSVGLDRFTGIWPCCESSFREALEINLFQVLGRQVALGEDEEAPEDPGAVGWLFIWCKRDE